MANTKTEFRNGTVVTTAFLQSIYGQGTDGGHLHDGKNEDGHCAPITLDQLAQEVHSRMIELISDKVIGEIRAYFGDVAPNNEYLLCDGSPVPNIPFYHDFRDWIDTNRRQELFYDNAYHTPDLRGKVLVCAGSFKDSADNVMNFSVGDSGGEYKHVLTVGELAKHNHYIKRDRDQADNPYHQTAQYSEDNNLNNWSAWTSSAGNDEPHNNIQPYAVVNYIIRVVGQKDIGGACDCVCNNS